MEQTVIDYLEKVSKEDLIEDWKKVNMVKVANMFKEPFTHIIEWTGYLGVLAELGDSFAGEVRTQARKMAAIHNRNFPDPQPVGELMEAVKAYFSKALSADEFNRVNWSRYIWQK